MKDGGVIPGERASARVGGTRSVAARFQQVFAATFVLTLGAAVLIWYYVHLGEDAKARTVTDIAAIRGAAASEMKLPAFERPLAPAERGSAAPSAEGETGIVGDALAAQGRAAPHAGASFVADRVAPVEDGATLRLRQDAPVLSRPPLPSRPSADAWSAALRDVGAAADAMQNPDPERNASGLAGALQPTVVKATEAAMLPSRRWLLPKGSFLDCTLETAIDSTFAGLTTCILATDVFGADGRVVLMERGTKLLGETRSEVRAGQARVAVLWDEARTPTGVVLSLASPGTDALGRAGVPGVADRHIGERFGAAVLLSLLDATVADFAAHRQGSGAVVYNAQGTSDVAAEVLRHTIAIPPTIRVAPGARLSVTVVRDVDFRAVYRLAPHAER